MAWYKDFFPPSVPLAAHGGIKARSKRGAFAAQWWAKRWIQVLEALNLGGRLQRGRSYARRGQVLNIDIEPGLVTATVQGSRPKPYAIRMNVGTIHSAALQRLRRELSTSPLFLAKLLAGEMPHEIEEVFERSRISLFPRRAGELRTECSCPDWSNPCKHIAAVYYLLGEEFDRDPFLIFKLRGIDAAELLGDLAGSSLAIDESQGAGEEDRVELARGAAPPEHFWEGSRPEVDLTSIEPPSHPAPLLRRLGNLPFWRAGQPLAESLHDQYAAASAHAVDLTTERISS